MGNKDLLTIGLVLVGGWLVWHFVAQDIVNHVNTPGWLDQQIKASKQSQYGGYYY